jgi:uncharacterized protein YjbI with pentapeptide repeats
MERFLKSQGSIRLSNFTCADVRGADFTGRALFTLAQKGVPNLFSAQSTFEAANVAEANFADLYFYGVQQFDPDFELPIKSLFHFGRYVGDIRTEVFAIDSQADLNDTSSKFSDSLTLLGYSWRGSNWRRAKLPKAVHELLTRMNMPDTPQPQVRLGCSPRTPW